MFDDIHRKVTTKRDTDSYTSHKALDALPKDRLLTYVRTKGSVTEHDNDQDQHVVRMFAMHQLMFLRLKAWVSDKVRAEIDRDDFTQMTFPMGHRQSSKSEDEPLCLGQLAPSGGADFILPSVPTRLLYGTNLRKLQDRPQQHHLLGQASNV